MDVKVISAEFLNVSRMSLLKAFQTLGLLSTWKKNPHKKVVPVSAAAKVKRPTEVVRVLGSLNWSSRSMYETAIGQH